MFLIKYLKSLLYTIISILIFTIIITTLNYFNLISGKLLNILQILSMIISVIIGGYYLGKTSCSKGYIQGLKIGLIILTILIPLNLFIFKTPFKISIIIFYIIILISSILGSILGINKKKKDKV